MLDMKLLRNFAGTIVLPSVVLAGCAATNESAKLRVRNLGATPLAKTSPLPARSVPKSQVAESKAPESQVVQAVQHAGGAAPRESTIVKAVSMQIPEQASHGEPVVAQAAPISNAAANQTADPELIAARAEAAVPIDLATALQLTAGQNPQVAFAQQRIQEAAAQYQNAQVLWVPSIRLGANYNKHEGRIQDVAGNIIDTSRGSFYTGLGSQAVGAGTPAVPGLLVNFHTSDAIFQSRIAQQNLAARRNASTAVRNDLMLDTAIAYTELLETLQVLAVAEETVEHAQTLKELTVSFAETGQGLQSDVDRAVTELSLRQIEQRRAAENARVASVRLSRLLSEDQGRALVPTEAQLVPVELVDGSAETRALVATGLMNRPELAESRYLVGEAVERLKRDQYAPLVPSVLLGLSYGGNGGGLGSDIENFGDRMDFDAAAFWEIRNFGLGEQAVRSAGRARIRQAQTRQVQTMDQIASEIAEAQIQVQERVSQIDIAKEAIAAARASYRRNNERIRDAQGLPIETLLALQALDQSQRQYIRAVADYNRAQFRLHRALGWPVQ